MFGVNGPTRAAETAITILPAESTHGNCAGLPGIVGTGCSFPSRMSLLTRLTTGPTGPPSERSGGACQHFLQARHFEAAGKMTRSLGRDLTTFELLR